MIGVFGIYRMSIRSIDKVVQDNENTFTPLPRNITPVGIQLDPETGVDLSSSENLDKK